jgi:hypothetical protein
VTDSPTQGENLLAACRTSRIKKNHKKPTNYSRESV